VRLGAILVAFVLVQPTFGEPPLPAIPTNVYSILNFGAYGNGTSNCTIAISNTINAAAVTGGTVLIPANGTLSTFLSGPITLTNHINLQIDGTLKMLAFGSYPTNPSPPDFISAKNLHDVKLSGSGTIQGQGTNWWIAYDASGITRPKAMFAPDACKTVLVENVTMRDPPNTHISIRNLSVNVNIRNVTMITADDTISANTDGIDVKATNCLIRDCSLSVGDDHVAIGGDSRTIIVTNCTFGNGHGMSIGSYTDGGVQDVMFNNCTLTVSAGLSSGIRIKSARGRGGLVQNLAYKDLTLTNVQNPIFISCYSPDSTIPTNPATDTGSNVTSLTPIYRNITISNVTSVAASSRNAGRLYGLPEMLISNITLSRVTTKADKTFDIYHAQALHFIDCQVDVPATTNTFNLYNVDFAISNSVPVTNLVRIGGWGSPLATNQLTLFNAQVIITDTNILPPNPRLALSKSTLTVTNNLSLGGGSILNFGLSTNATCVVTAGNLKLAGSLNITDAGGFTNTPYTLFTYGGTLTYNGLNIVLAPTGYSYVISTNTPGQVNLVVLSALQAWQMNYFGSTNNPAADPSADPDGDGQDNEEEFLSGTNPTNSASAFQVVSCATTSNDLVVTWRTVGGHTNAVQVTSGNYNTNFTDLSGSIVITGSGDQTTNYTDGGGATNVPARYYRVRLLP
jgi:polygalacturonase